MNEFIDLKNIWSNYGEDDVYWSVLTSPEYKREVITKETIKQFFESAECNIQTLESISNEHGVSLIDKNILDFGCGVGRLSLSLAPYCNHVTGIDIFQGHINTANHHKHEFEIHNVDFFLSQIEIRSFGTFEAIVSLIVLQHNRPTLMKSYIKQLLQMLNENDFSLLHIPYSIPNYKPNLNLIYGMEMHYLNLEDIQTLAYKCNCIVHKHDVDMCGGNIKNAIFFFQKLV